MTLTTAATLPPAALATNVYSPSPRHDGLAAEHGFVVPSVKRGSKAHAPPGAIGPEASNARTDLAANERCSSGPTLRSPLCYENGGRFVTRARDRSIQSGPGPAEPSRDAAAARSTATASREMTHAGTNASRDLRGDDDGRGGLHGSTGRPRDRESGRTERRLGDAPQRCAHHRFDAGRLGCYMGASADGSLMGFATADGFQRWYHVR